MILITGAEGYIGSHLCARLNKLKRIKFMSTSISEHSRHALRLKDIDTIIHLAAYIDAGESVKNPIKYYKNNVGYTMNLLQWAPPDCKFIFASSAAAKDALTPYGESKRMCEKIIHDSRLPYVNLRFFNVAGGNENHKPETHVIPLALRGYLHVYGDGFNLRDYVHVEDVVDAILAAVDYEGERLQCDIGTGVGSSVWNILDSIKRVKGKTTSVVFVEDRLEDPILIADPKRAREKLNWEAQYNLDQIIASYPLGNSSSVRPSAT